MYAVIPSQQIPSSFPTLTGPTLLFCVVLHCAEGAIELDSCLELFRVLGIENFHTLVETDHFVTDHFVSVSAEQGGRAQVH
jgi:hypothetical protein